MLKSILDAVLACNGDCRECPATCPILDGKEPPENGEKRKEDFYWSAIRDLERLEMDEFARGKADRERADRELTRLRNALSEAVESLDNCPDME